MRCGKIGRMLAVMTGVLVIPGIGAAQGRGPCHDDVQRLCKDVGPASLRACMRQHASELSPACKARIDELKEHVRQRAASLKAACQADAEHLCSDVKAGKRRIAECLRQHEAQLSPGCKTALNTRPGSRVAAPTTPGTAAPTTPVVAAPTPGAPAPPTPGTAAK